MSEANVTLEHGAAAVTGEGSPDNATVRAIRYRQRVAGVKEDGVVGPKTLAAIRALRPARAVEQLSDIREEFYRSLPLSVVVAGLLRHLLRRACGVDLRLRRGRQGRPSRPSARAGCVGWRRSSIWPSSGLGAGDGAGGMIRTLTPHAWAAVALDALASVIILTITVLSWSQSRYDAGFKAADDAGLRANAEALNLNAGATETAADERLNDTRSTSTLRD